MTIFILEVLVVIIEWVAEISYKNKLNLRFGRNQYGYFSTGIGLSWTNFELNYGYQLNSNTNDLGSNHVISFDINPNWLKSITEDLF